MCIASVLSFIIYNCIFYYSSQAILCTLLINMRYNLSSVPLCNARGVAGGLQRAAWACFSQWITPSLCHNIFTLMEIYYDYIRIHRNKFFYSSPFLSLSLTHTLSLCIFVSLATGLQSPPNVCNLCFKMLPSLAALETHLQSEHAKEVALPPARNHNHNEAGSSYVAKVSSNLTFGKAWSDYANVGERVTYIDIRSQVRVLTNRNAKGIDILRRN